MSSEHYLELELRELVRSNVHVFDFFETGSLDGIWYWDLENPEQEWMSRRFWEVLGYDPATKEHRSSEWKQLIHPDDLAVTLANLEKHKADPEFHFDQVSRYKHADGHTVWVRCRGLIVRDEDGVPLRMLGAHNDVSDLKQAEASLQQHAEALERSNSELAQFAHVVSHDLKAPLRTIHSFTERLERQMSAELGDRDLSEGSQQSIQYILRASDRLAAMVEDVLHWSESESAELRTEPVDSAAVMADCVLDLQQAIEEAGAAVEQRELPIVSGSPQQLGRLFAKLLRNALKFRGAAPLRIEISAERSGDLWEFAIADNGAGFPQAEAERIFEPFQRYGEGKEQPGTGLGLSICRQIVERHGGTIRAESVPDAGTTFRFTLPAA